MAAEVIAVVSSALSCATAALTLVSPCLREPMMKAYTIFIEREDKLKTLESNRDALNQQRGEVIQQSKDKVLSKSLKVSKWLRTADQAVKKVNISKFQDKIESSCCCLPNYIAQYKAGEEIVKKNAELEALKKEGERFIDVQESNVVGRRKGTRSTKLLGEAASEKVEEIYGYVTGHEQVGTILVYGMTGLGKRSIVSEVHDRVLGFDTEDTNRGSEADAETSSVPVVHDRRHESDTEDINRGSEAEVEEEVEEEHFKKVIWVTVENKETTQKSISNLQKKIADKLQIDFQKASENKADTLATELRKLRFLIILDDMWKDLPLEDIGIPNPTKENGCKVIIISRLLPVIGGMKYDKRVEIEPLSVKEAEEMFERHAGMKLSQLKEDVTDAAKKMIYENGEGLPSAIELLALTFKQSNNIVEEVDAKFLEEVTSGFLRQNEKVFNRLKDSYYMLTEQAKQCFLYCALFPSDHNIDKKELEEYWFWEGLLDDMKKPGELLDDLNRAYLVQTETITGVGIDAGKKQIKMFNIVRHMAVHLAKTSPGKFIILDEKEIFADKFSDAERASLMGNNIKSLMKEPKLPKLSTLLLQHNPNITRVNGNFFNSMPNIKVLDLTDTGISLQNSAFSKLTKLRALLWRKCSRLESVPSIANSKELLVLDLSDTPIKQLPDGMKELTNLIRLNLSRTRVTEFQVDIVKALVSLEELLMITNDVYSAVSLWGSEQSANSIKALRVHPKLATLHITFPDAESFDRYVDAGSNSHSLSEFKIIVGGSYDETKLLQNGIVFIESNFLVKGTPVSLPEETSELRVMSNKDLRWLPIYHLDSLKVINISGCESLVYLFKTKSGVLYTLPNLERISVEKCQKMEALIEYNGKVLQFHPPRLERLKFIQISDCESLVYLFETEMLHYFPQLEEISITRGCQDKEEEKKELVELPLPLLLVDPLELNKTEYRGTMMRNPAGPQTIWTFPQLKMKIITTSLLPKPRTGLNSIHSMALQSKKIVQASPVTGTKLIRRTNSFGSTMEATATRPQGDLPRTLSGGLDSKEGLEHANTLSNMPNIANPGNAKSNQLQRELTRQSKLDKDDGATKLQEVATPHKSPEINIPQAQDQEE